MCVVLQPTFLGSQVEPGHPKNYPLLNTCHGRGTMGAVSLVFSPTPSPARSTLIMCVRIWGPEGPSHLISHSAPVGAYVNLELSRKAMLHLLLHMHLHDPATLSKH